jgi:peptidyl-prolyl cis-trans isomerase D
MSIIQDIREKYAKLTVVVIAVALIGFILTDYFSGRGGGGGGRGTSKLGSVNGKSIDAVDFARKKEITENNYRSNGYPAEMASSQALNDTWQQEINSLLVKGETDKLGMSVGKKELGDMLYSPTSPVARDLRQQLTDEGGGYDPTRASQAISARMKDKNTDPKWKASFTTYVESLTQTRLTEKYASLLINSTNYPRWFLEKQNADNTQIGKISLVRESYMSIVDSTVKLDDKEIADYINKHKDDFKQEESRSISYVTFSAAPTASDSQLIRNQLLELKRGMDTTDDIAAFMANEGRTYSDLYQSGNQLGIIKDTIKKMAKNEVFGPYVEGRSYALLKLIDTRTMPDSVTARHILIATAKQDQSGQFQQTRDTVSAFNQADSIAKAIQKGTANFDSMVVKFSEDEGSKQKGGVYENIYYGQMVGPFNDFVFLNPVGAKQVVKTDFGYHYIEIMSQKGSNLAYKTALLTRDIISTQETDEKAEQEASQFAAESKDAKGFDELFEKTQRPKNRVKGNAVGIKPNDAQVSGLGYSRDFVRSVYKAKLGEVLKPETVGDNYVVAVVTNVLEEGTKSPATVRAEGGMAMRTLMNRKKAAILKQKIGKVTTLEAAAVALGGKQIETIDSVRLNFIPTIGYEPRVSGATFFPGNKGKVVPEALEGDNGVYVIRVESVSATPGTTDVAEQRRNLYEQTKRYFVNPEARELPQGHPLSSLLKTAKIKDKRAEIY